MIKMVLNNNCVIKMQIIASERRRRPNTSLFALSLSLVALGKKRVSALRYRKKIYCKMHSILVRSDVYIEMPCDTDLFQALVCLSLFYSHCTFRAVFVLLFTIRCGYCCNNLQLFCLNINDKRVLCKFCTAK